MFSAPVLDIPQQVIDEVLADGGNDRSSKFLITARMKKDFPIEENATYLRRNYRTGGKGFILDGKHVSAWWDADGIRIDNGNTAQAGSATALSWEQAARRVRELLDMGRYMSQDELDVVDHMERRDLAERLLYVYRDDFHKLPPEWNTHKGFPDDAARVAELLAQPESRDQIIENLRADASAQEAEHSGQRRWHNAHRLLDDVSALQRTPLTFISGNRQSFPDDRRFITQDEIDAALCDGSMFEGGKGRIYRYYQAAHTDKERADFLKKEYGIGGRSHALSGASNSSESHDSKGIELSRGYLSEPYAKVTLNWLAAAKRIGELVKQGRYLTPEEAERLRKEEETPKAIELTKETSPPAPSVEMWLSDMFEQHATEIITRVMNDEPYRLAISGVTDAQNAQVELEAALQRVFTGYLDENMDLYRAYADYPDFRKRLCEYVFQHTYVETPIREREETPPAQTQDIEPDDAPRVLAALDEYNRQKEAHPEHIVLVQVSDHYETYGEDAKLVALMLNANLLERTVPGAGNIEMTGFTPASMWVDYGKQLWSKGHDVLLLGSSEQGSFETVKEYRKDDFIPIGMSLTIDNRQFVVDSVNYRSGSVSLRDNTFAVGTGFPIFRVEPIDFVRSYVEEQQWEDMEAEPPTEQTLDVDSGSPDAGDAKLREVVIHLSGIPPYRDENQPVSNPVPIGTQSEKDAFVPTGTQADLPSASNYRITDDHLGEGGQRTKADRNIESIRVLKGIEGEHRGAIAAEQETLSQYVGWGGIPQIFDEANTDWQERRETLKNLLSPDEYAAARASTLNAHYTSPTVIRAIYHGLENLGFRQGNILEPACGTGNFFGVLPQSMSESKFYGVELDSITGRIAQKLYPQAKIAVQGFEHAQLPDSFFDAAVGNVPFGAYSLPDPKYDRHHFRIHDYFFAKTLDKVRPGGVIAFVTSKGTMDKLDSSVRRYIAQRAELLGAIRLPNTAFKANAGTEVTTDILFLQKRDHAIDIEPDWIQIGKTEDGMPINQYFLDHPDMLLGTMAFDRSMYGNEQETTCNAIPGANLAEQLEKTIANIQGQYEEFSIDDPAPDESRIPADPTVPNFSFTVNDGKVYFRRDSLMERCDLSATDDKRARGMIALRDLTRELIQAQLSGASDESIHGLQAELNKRYDSFTQQYGLLSDKRNAAVFREDDGYYLLTSLEILDDERKLERKSDIFTKRTIAQNLPISHVETAPEALAVSMAERAKVDLDFMQELTGMDKDKLLADLTGLVYQNPVGNPEPYEQWETADEYLSGDVRQKLRAAEAAVAALGAQYIPVTLWFITRGKKNAGKTVFIDARNMGSMVDRIHRELSDEDIARIADTVLAFQNGTLEDQKGFCAVKTIREIGEQDYILTPGRYVGIEEQEDDGEPFEEKMTRLTSELSELFEKSHELEKEIREKLGAIGYGI